jgi:hypothetical protein
MLTCVLSGPPDTRDAIAAELQRAGAIIDPDPAKPSGGFPPEDFAWITCNAESVAAIAPVTDASDWRLRLHWPNSQPGMTLTELNQN